MNLEAGYSVLNNIVVRMMELYFHVLRNKHYFRVQDACS